MSKKSETKLLTTFLKETEKVLKDELPSTQKDDIIRKLKERWDFLNVRTTFEEFLVSHKLPSLSSSDVFGVKADLSKVFPEDKIQVTPNEKEGTLAVSVEMPEGTLSGELVVTPEDPKEEKPKFVFFPTVLSTDPGLAWCFSHIESMTQAEARIALNTLESDFWNTKKGLKALKMGVPRTFASFVERVPAGALKEKGLKRNFVLPATIKMVDKEPGEDKA